MKATILKKMEKNKSEINSKVARARSFTHLAFLRAFTATMLVVVGVRLARRRRVAGRVRGLAVARLAAISVTSLLRLLLTLNNINLFYTVLFMLVLLVEELLIIKVVIRNKLIRFSLIKSLSNYLYEH